MDDSLPCSGGMLGVGWRDGSLECTVIRGLQGKVGIPVPVPVQWGESCTKGQHRIPARLHLERALRWSAAARNSSQLS